MKAVLVHELGGPEVLTYQDWELPEPKAGQLRIKTVFTSVNFADVKARQGTYGKQVLPFIPGLDAAGVVDAVGEGVTAFHLGDRVAAYVVGGAYAEYVLAEDALCFALPQGVSFEQGAGIGILLTAYNVLMRAGRFVNGETVLIHAGAGGVGSTLIQLAKVLGAAHIFATVGSDAKADLVRTLGANEVINYREQDFAKAVLELTAGRGVDLILDSIAGRTSEMGMGCLANFGRLVVYGHTSEDGAAMISSQLLHKQNRGVIGYSSGGYRTARPEGLQEAAVKGLGLLASGEVAIVLGERFKLQDVARAHAFVESRQSTGKVLLEP